MTRSKIAVAMLILAGVAAWSCAAPAAFAASGQDRLAQTTAPQLPAPAAPQADDHAIGGVATLQGGASVTRNNAASALKLSDTIFKGDVVQTAADGTLGITFDDETTFTLQPNSRMEIDDFVYQEGGTGNAAAFEVLRGTVAFVASAVAKSGDMKISTPTATLGIRGTTGIVEVSEAGGTAGQASIKLYPDADGRVGRIEIFERNGVQLGILSRGATGFSIRPGAAGRFTAVALQISAQESARDRSFVRQAFSTQLLGRQMNNRRRNLQRQNGRRPNGQRQNGQRPNGQRPNQLRPNPQRPQAPRGGRRRR